MHILAHLTKFTSSRIATGCALLVAMIGLAGWAFDVEPRKRLHPQWATLEFNTALSLFLAGAGLSWRASPPWAPCRAARKTMS